MDFGYTAPAAANGFLGDVAGGIRIGRWGLGAATGMDWAKARSFPLLLDTRWRAVRGKHALDVFTQEGRNFVSEKKDDDGDTWGKGWYWRGGLSVRLVEVKGFGGLYVSGSARYRSYEEYVPRFWIDFPPDYAPSSGLIRHDDWAFVGSIGWRW